MTSAPTRPRDPAAAREAIQRNKLWYHTMELAPGVVTPGWFDLRPIVDLLPWPAVEGRRCLDIGCWDGFFSFELERRGAAEVVATDIASPTQWDWPYPLRRRGPQTLTAMAGHETGTGFRLARQLLGSSVERLETSVYDLAPEKVGVFDVVVCGSLLLHLRDPLRALEAIRGVCRGHLLSAEAISVPLTALAPRRPLAAIRSGERGQWWVPNAPGHRAMVASAGFEIERRSRPYAVPFGRGHRLRRHGRRLPRPSPLARAITRGSGVPHSAVLARPLP